MKKLSITLTVILSSLLIYGQYSNYPLYVCNSKIEVHEKPKFSNSKGTLYRFDTVRVIDSVKKYYEVKINHFSEEITGFALKTSLITWCEYLEKYELPKKEDKIAHLNELQELFGVVKGLKIFHGLYWIGMTEREAYFSLGEPTRRSIKIGTWGSQKRLIFPRAGDGTNLLVLNFCDGILTNYSSGPL